jgi:asparagine synthase (glutamine-hydrolysing)
LDCRSIDGVTLGATRLAIVDPEGGHQPIGGKCTDFTIVFNGEIYNHRDLRHDLSETHQWRGESDTETLLHLFEEEGPRCLGRLNGMFACAITNGSSTHLVRDRLGIKPLYYTVVDETLIFASELKALLSATGRRPVRLDPDYGVLEWTTSWETPFQGILQVPAGEYVRIDSGTGHIIRHRWFDPLGSSVKDTPTEEVASSDVRRLVEDAISLRTQSAPPFAAYVSGGIDSAIIALTSRPSLLLSCLTPDVPWADEASYLAVLENVTSAELVRLTPEPADFVRGFTEMMWALEIPANTLAAFPQFLLAQELNRRGIRIALSGLGADEYFCGYVRQAFCLCHASAHIGRQYTDYATLLSQVPREAQPHEKYFSLINRGSGLHATAARDLVKDVFASASSLGAATSLVEQRVSLPGLLHVEDRLNMWFGVESRAPFLDYRLVDKAMRLPDDHKVRCEGRQVITKRALRRAFQDVVPFPILSRTDKVGFPSAVGIWLAQAFPHAVASARQVVRDVNALRPIDVGAELSTGVFSRKNWQIVQWAAWYLLFYEEMERETVEMTLFGGPDGQS